MAHEAHAKPDAAGTKTMDAGGMRSLRVVPSGWMTTFCLMGVSDENTT